MVGEYVGDEQHHYRLCHNLPLLAYPWHRLSMVVIDWLWGTTLCFGVTLGTCIVAVRVLDDRGAPLMEYGGLM